MARDTGCMASHGFTLKAALKKSTVDYGSRQGSCFVLHEQRNSAMDAQVSWHYALLVIQVRPAAALLLTVDIGCNVSNGFTLSACLEEIDNGLELSPGELLWYGHEERNSAMDSADREWRKVATAMLKRLHNEYAPLPALDLISFLEMWRQCIRRLVIEIRSPRPLPICLPISGQPCLPERSRRLTTMVLANARLLCRTLPTASLHRTYLSAFALSS